MTILYQLYLFFIKFKKNCILKIFLKLEGEYYQKCLIKDEVYVIRRFINEREADFDLSRISIYSYDALPPFILKLECT